MTLFSSSIGKKLGMAVTGLLLFGFLLGHLSGNLLLLRGDGGAAFNAYSDFLVQHPLLIPVEFILLGIFLLHVVLAISVARDNRRARPIGYRVSAAVGGRSVASRTMIYSGLITLIFVVVHLKTFKYADHAGGSLYGLVTTTFGNEFYVGGYVVAMVLLGFHLWHAFQSAFQTMGLQARIKLRRFSIGLCVLIAGGFAMIPLVIYFGR